MENELLEKLKSLSPEARATLAGVMSGTTTGTEAKASISAARQARLNEATQQYASVVAQVQDALRSALRGVASLKQMQATIDAAAGDLGIPVNSRFHREVDGIASQLGALLPDGTLPLSGVIEAWTQELKVRRTNEKGEGDL